MFRSIAPVLLLTACSAIVRGRATPDLPDGTSQAADAEDMLRMESTTTDDGTDARPDANVRLPVDANIDNDIPKDTPLDARSVPCGRSMCDGDVDECCNDATGGGRCVPRGTCGVRCNGAARCTAPGTLCCVTTDRDGVRSACLPPGECVRDDLAGRYPTCTSDSNCVAPTPFCCEAFTLGVSGVRVCVANCGFFPTGCGRTGCSISGICCAVNNTCSPAVCPQCCVSVTPPTGPVPSPRPTQLSVGPLHTCARMEDGTVRCWGADSVNQLGDGSASAVRPWPTMVRGLSGVAEVAAGATHTCARMNDGTVRCWGNNASGEAGIGWRSDGTPGEVPGLAGVAEVSVGGEATTGRDGRGVTCVRDEDNVLRCWGATGGLIDPASRPAMTPTVVPGVPRVARVRLGEWQSCAVTTEGALWCWGRVPGSASTGGVLSATLVGGISEVADVVAAHYQTCVLLRDGSVWCWGANLQGEVGDGTTVSRPTPTHLVGLVDVVQLAGGFWSTCALVRDGSVWCWGANDHGTLGDGTTTDQHTPTRVPGLSGIVEIASGGGSVCARTSEGRVFCWGNNLGGQLGDGTRTARLRPTPVVW